MIHIRHYQPEDWSSLWAILEPVFRAGETYAVPRDISDQDAHRLWIEQPRIVHVAVDDTDELQGSYFLKANQAGPGDHVCNCGYLVAEWARGQGIASDMCQHSLTLARELGFIAMQYNLVVASNEAAIRQWQKQGFSIIGTLPRAFHHPWLGLTDAQVMYRLL